MLPVHVRRGKEGILVAPAAIDVLHQLVQLHEWTGGLGIFRQPTGQSRAGQGITKQAGEMQLAV